MKTYENDTKTRIPKWFYHVPSAIVNGVMGCFDFFEKFKRKERREINLENKQNITFYL